MNGWCKIKKGAAYAGVSDRTFEDWLKQGLKYIRMPSGLRLVKYSSIDEFLERFADAKNRVEQVVDEIMSKM